MKVTVLQENLLTGLNQVLKAVAAKPQLPILSGILVSIDDVHEATLSATDLYLGIKVRVALKAETTGNFVIPARELRDVCASLDPGPLVLEFTDTQVVISAHSITATLQLLPVQEYPAFPEKSGETYSIPGDMVSVVSKILIPCASKDATRPILTSLLFSFTPETLTCVATDSFRLAMAQCSITTTQPASFLLPAAALQEVLSIVMKSGSGEDVQVTVSGQLQQAYVESKSVSVFMRLIEGTYPPYEKILPTSSNTLINCDRTDLVAHLKRALIFAKNTGSIVQFNYQENQLQLSVPRSTIGQFTAQVKIDSSSGDPVVIACNARYLLEFLQSLTQDSVSLSCIDGYKPLVVTPLGSSESVMVKEVIMPFKIHSES